MKKKICKALVAVMVLSAVVGGFLPVNQPGRISRAYIEDYDDRDFRLAGDNRFATAGEIAKRNGTTSKEVIIVRGDSVEGIPQVVDGLTASALAGARDAQILLVTKDRLPDTTEKIIKDLNATKATIVGGEAAVSRSVKEDLQSLGLSTERIEGSNRFETAAEVGLRVPAPRNNTAIIVNGNSEVDSLVAGPLAHRGYPILMVNNQRGTIPEATEKAIKSLHIDNLIIVGGTGVVSEELETDLNDMEGVTVKARYGGSNRVETSLSLASHPDFSNNSGVSLVNGGAYVDAVAASTLGKPVVYFTERGGINPDIQDYLFDKEELLAIGGEAVITDEVLQKATPAIGFRYYGSLHRRSPNIRRYETGFVHNTMNLLLTAQNHHSEGDFDKALKSYDLLLTQRDLLPDNMESVTTSSRQKALEREGIQTIQEALKEAEGITSVTSKFNAFAEGYSVYGWHGQYGSGYLKAAEDLLNWGLARHEDKSFDEAIGRYNMIIESSNQHELLDGLAGEARFYSSLANQRVVWNSQDLNMRFSRYRESFGDALGQQIQQNRHTVWSASDWKSPSEEDVAYYLNPQNFYIPNWLEEDRDPEFIQIASNTLRVREGPSTSNDILSIAYQEEIYPVKGESNGWFRIRKDGKDGWVAGSHVHRIGKNTGVSNVRVRVNTGTLNVRTGPSTNFQRIGTVSDGEEFTLREHKNGWHKIQYFGTEGWISGNFAEPVYDVPARTFQFLELQGLVPARASEINTLIDGDPNLTGYANTLRTAGRENNINELYLTVHALKESEGPNSVLLEGIEVTEVEGSSVAPTTVYNVFGIEANGTDPVQSGAEFAYEQGWTTKEAAILEGTKWISENFINHPRNPQDTLYKMRWDPGRNGKNPFSSNIKWADEIGARIHEAYRILDKESLHFDISVYKTRAWPVPGHTRISSPYGYRIHPITGDHRMHIGIDIPAPGGTPIVAAKAGRVTVSHYGASYGNWIEIDHGNGITTRYAHNSSNIAKVGDWVEKGETIALVGTTGSSTGNHLHFEVRHNNNHFDPLPWLQGN
ncbi:cell wall-binding repeat-containing protein [Isachenkonia alkalipeptolytica]|uniref:SH3b domain-containing protein n=1 Tax=Isachenkonia alkalipeptolytica TaxID=2565777 RepID=A0AA43XL42_9CLOT|nr:cell wall-binding repeat-containing protein [Isachenkonia alkalipeptolytica]NBG88868.1 hypothetical protein [Isachenkonia alkalipeptolytica]